MLKSNMERRQMAQYIFQQLEQYIQLALACEWFAFDRDYIADKPVFLGLRL